MHSPRIHLSHAISTLSLDRIPPVARFVYEAEGQTLTIAVGSPETPSVVIGGIGIRELMAGMACKNLARALEDEGHYVVRLPAGVSWRPDAPTHFKDVHLEQFLVRGEDPYRSCVQGAELRVVRVRTSSRAPAVGLRLTTSICRVHLDVNVEIISAALLHLRALNGCGAHPSTRIRTRSFVPFWVRLPDGRDDRPLVA